MALKKTESDLLVFLASRGAADRFVGETTSSLAASLRVPQQTVSRWAIELEHKGFVERGAEGYKLTAKAAGELRETYSLLSAAFGEKKAHHLEGTVVSGVGDGGYYISQKNYSRQFKQKLGFAPFPGTLNLRLHGAADVAERMKMLAAGGIRISGFSEGGRAFGAASCFPATLVAKGGRAEGAVIVPERSHYGTDIVEFVSPKNLKKALSLRDGDRAALEVRQLPISK